MWEGVQVNVDLVTCNCSSVNSPCLKVVFTPEKNPALSRVHLCWKTDNGDCNTYASDAVNHLMCLMNACQYNVVLKVMQVTPLKYPSDEKPTPHRTAHSPSTLLQGVHSTNLLPHLQTTTSMFCCWDRELGLKCA